VFLCGALIQSEFRPSHQPNIFSQGMTHSVCAGCSIFPVLVSLETAQLHPDDDCEKEMNVQTINSLHI
jgi:hypothetical protein